MGEPNLEGSTGPMHERIAIAMAADIRSGTLQPGDRLPGHRELAAKLGILTVSTVSRAFREVIQQKLIDAGTRRGTHVRADIGVATSNDQRQAAGGNWATGQPIDLRGHRAPSTTWANALQCATRVYRARRLRSVHPSTTSMAAVTCAVAKQVPRGSASRPVTCLILTGCSSATGRNTPCFVPCSRYAITVMLLPPNA